MLVEKTFLVLKAPATPTHSPFPLVVLIIGGLGRQEFQSYVSGKINSIMGFFEMISWV
jgi:hypothetical protein